MLLVFVQQGRWFENSELVFLEVYFVLRTSLKIASRNYDIKYSGNEKKNASNCKQNQKKTWWR